MNRWGVLSEKQKNIVRKHIFCYTLLLIPIIHFIIFWVCVNVHSLILPFQDEKTGAFTWGNFRYIIDMFQTDELLIPLKNTHIYYVQGITTSFIIAPLFAYFLYKKIVGYKIFNFIFMIPMMVSGVIMIIIYKNMVSVDGPVGILYEKLTGEVMSPLLYSDKTATGTIVAYGIWTGFGLNLILFTGAMVKISPEIIESAQLEGIGFLREFFSIELPLIWPTLSIQLLLSANGVFSASGPILYFTEGAYKTSTINFWFYVNVIRDGNYERASALGILLTLAGVPITIVVAILRKKLQTDATY